MSKTAVITGATSGIGAAYAKRLASDGYDLIITGRRQEIIQNLAEKLKEEYGIDVKVIIAELADDNDIQKVIDVISNADDIEVLINNAGYAGEIMQCMDNELANHEKMIKVHQIAPLRLIYAVIPKMIQNGKGSIINVSSMGVYMPSPMTYLYTATKSFLKQFTEGLHQELKEKGIKVQVLCPAFIQTDLYRDVNPGDRNILFQKAKMFTMTPEDTVDISLKYLKKNKPVCLPSIKMGFSAMIFQNMPRRPFYKLMGKMTEI